MNAEWLAAHRADYANVKDMIRDQIPATATDADELGRVYSLVRYITRTDKLAQLLPTTEDYWVRLIRDAFVALHQENSVEPTKSEVAIRLGTSVGLVDRYAANTLEFRNGSIRDSLLGQKFGNWKVVNDDEINTRMVTCDCTCGRTKGHRISLNNLTSGRSSGCRLCRHQRFPKAKEKQSA
jgi:hypothetical protein